MAKGICSIDGCDRETVARGWCRPHWKKWWRHGDPLWRPPTEAERFFARVNTNGPVPDYAPHLGACWLWTGSNTGRYGMFTIGRRNIGAHRWSYQHAVGAIPEGLQLDHLCRVTLCVNPAHLEPVTGKENRRRGFNPCLAKSHCPQGHPYDAENTWYDKHGHRSCRACNRERQRARNRAYREAHPLESRTHCHNGHEYTPENTYVYPNGARSCRICRRLQRRKRLAKPRKPPYE